MSVVYYVTSTHQVPLVRSREPPPSIVVAKGSVFVAGVLDFSIDREERRDVLRECAKRLRTLEKIRYREH